MYKLATMTSIIAVLCLGSVSGTANAASQFDVQVIPINFLVSNPGDEVTVQVTVTNTGPRVRAKVKIDRWWGGKRNFDGSYTRLWAPTSAWFFNNPFGNFSTVWRRNETRRYTLSIPLEDWRFFNFTTRSEAIDPGGYLTWLYIRVNRLRQVSGNPDLSSGRFRLDESERSRAPVPVWVLPGISG